MSAAGRETTLADVRVGGSAVLIAGGALDARQARRLVELGLRPGATVRVMMRTAGGGRVLGVDNLRIVVDRQTLAAIPVTLPAPAPSPLTRTITAAHPGTTPARRPTRRRLRLLGRSPRLTALPGEAAGEGTD